MRLAPIGLHADRVSHLKLSDMHAKMGRGSRVSNFVKIQSSKSQKGLGESSDRKGLAHTKVRV